MTVYDDHTVPAIDCVEFVQLVDDLVDSDPQQWGAIVARHLDECPPCLVYLQQVLDLKVLLSQVSVAEVIADEDVAAVMERLNRFRRGSS